MLLDWLPPLEGIRQTVRCTALVRDTLDQRSVVSYLLRVGGLAMSLNQWKELLSQWSKDALETTQYREYIPAEALDEKNR